MLLTRGEGGLGWREREAQACLHPGAAWLPPLSPPRDVEQCHCHAEAEEEARPCPAETMPVVRNGGLRFLPFLLMAALAPLCLQGALGEMAAEAEKEQVQVEVVHLPEECSPKSKKGDLLNAHYDGYLASDRSKFYCSRTQSDGHPKWFVLGVGQVIKGLDIAMLNMCPGEKRKVIIPPSLAYGEHGYGCN